MLQRILDALLNCNHRRTTFPMTPERVRGKVDPIRQTAAGTYVACLDCGREFAYDWTNMRIGAQKRPIDPSTGNETVVRSGFAS